MHASAAPVILVNARPAKLDRLARIIDQLRKIIFRGTVEADAVTRAVAPHEPIDPDNALLDIGILTFIVDQQQMLEIGIEAVAFAPVGGIRGRGLGPHFFYEYAVSQSLRGSHVAVCLSQSDRKTACLNPHILEASGTLRLSPQEVASRDRDWRGTLWGYAMQRNHLDAGRIWLPSINHLGKKV
jgi:hypothetical protein